MSKETSEYLLSLPDDSTDYRLILRNQFETDELCENFINSLPRRQKQVAILLKKKLSVKEISAILEISQQQVNEAIKRIKNKLGV